MRDIVPKLSASVPAGHLRKQPTPPWPQAPGPTEPTCGAEPPFSWTRTDLFHCWEGLVG